MRILALLKLQIVFRCGDRWAQRKRLHPIWSTDHGLNDASAVSGLLFYLAVPFTRAQSVALG
jgi:hypothetical protein